MTKKFICALMPLVFLLCLCGCARNVKCADAAADLDGISLSVEKCSLEVAKNGVSLFHTQLKAENKSDTPISSLSFEMDVLDKNGGLLHTFQWKYVKSETPLSLGEAVSFSQDFHSPIEGKPHSLTLRITGYTDPSQLPAPHIPQKGEYLYQALSSPYLSGLTQAQPVMVNIVIDHMGAQETAEITDSDTIDKLVSAFTKVKIGEETGEFVTDNYNGISFTFSNGSVVGISLNLKNLELSINGEYLSYELEDFEELWRLMNDLAEFQ